MDPAPPLKIQTFWMNIVKYLKKSLDPKKQQKYQFASSVNTFWIHACLSFKNSIIP